MTTSTGAEGTLGQGQDMTTSAGAGTVQQQEWTRTSGVAAPWIFAGSNVAFVAAPDASTVTLEGMSPVVLGIEWLDVKAMLDRQPAKEQLPLFSEAQDPLQLAVLNVLAYTPEPDEPAEGDVEPGLEYRLPG